MLGVGACGGRALETREPGVAVLSTRSALVIPHAPPKLSCSGEAFCRETVLLESSPEIESEVVSDCHHHGGMSRAGGCSRHDVVATCSVESGEHGPVLVLTYAQVDDRQERENVSTMSDLCEKYEGTFHLAKR